MGLFNLFTKPKSDADIYREQSRNRKTTHNTAINNTFNNDYTGHHIFRVEGKSRIDGHNLIVSGKVIIGWFQLNDTVEVYDSEQNRVMMTITKIEQLGKKCDYTTEYNDATITLSSLSTIVLKEGDLIIKPGEPVTTPLL